MPRVLASLIALSSVSLAHAETPPPAPPPEVRVAEDGKTLVRLTTSWETGARLKIGKKKAKTLSKGVVAGTVIAGHGIVICAVGTEKSKPFRAYAISEGKLGKAVSVARPVKRSDSPFAVIGTATPDGFSIFYQEVQTDDPTAAHTYLVKLDKTGEASGKAEKVAVPWSLADAIWNGKGYHLALFYPGDQRGMRLSMVSLTEAGVPEQHPDWASAAGFIADVHLHRDDKKIRAFYRGGPGGEKLLESDVTTIRAWGSEPPKAKSHGSLSASKAIVVSAAGKVRKVSRK